MSMPTIPKIKLDSDISTCDAVNLIIASVAKQEEAIANILNAEKCKICAAIQEFRCCGDHCKLLEINESVRDTIKNLTKLEILLDSKLDSVKEIAKNCACAEICCC